jgi:hypothetical protein
MAHDKVSIISTALYEEVLERAYKFAPTVEADEVGGGYTVAIPDLLIHGDGPSLFAALQDLAENLLDYAADYFKRVDFFARSQNRKDHYPYLRRIVDCNDLRQIY